LVARTRTIFAEVERLSRKKFRALRAELAELDAFHNVVVDPDAVSEAALDEIREILVNYGIAKEVLPNSESVEDAVWAIKARAAMLL
jgi:hypothetical protein